MTCTKLQDFRGYQNIQQLAYIDLTCPKKTTNSDKDLLLESKIPCNVTVKIPKALIVNYNKGQTKIFNFDQTFEC